MQGSQLATTDDPPIRKYLGLPTLTALVVANMIGAGVFTSSGFSMASAQPSRPRYVDVGPMCWMGNCRIDCLRALAKRMPLSGGEYLFLAGLCIQHWDSWRAGFR